MYSRKRISQNSFPNFIFIFPKSFMIFCQEPLDPKRNYKNQIGTQAPKDVLMKKYSGFELTPASGAGSLSLDHQSQIIKVPTNLQTLQTILNLCIPDKELAKTHSQIHSYISKVIWTNKIPKGTKRKILCLCPGSNWGSQRSHC